DMMRDFIEDRTRVQLERVPGVSQVEVNGGAQRQIQILVDAPKLAERKITLTDLRDAIRERNVDLSAGDVDSGKRRYLLRTLGRFQTLDELRDLIIVRRGDSITRLRDVAEVNFDHFEIRSRTFTNGEPNIRLSLIRNTGSNVMEIKRTVLPVVEQMNRDILRPAGLQMLLSNDDVRYVEDSVGNVWSNIFIGAALAAAVLYCYLRSVPATLIGMCGMPVCSVASFIGLLLLGRTINVISLAGVAFAIGMTVDNTIVVLESIQQERQKGKSAFQAALDGTRNVAAAVFSGTMTTVLVFLPLLFVKEEAGQLFSDIGIAICASILVSMLVAVTLVPVAYANLPRLGLKDESAISTTPRKRLLGPVTWLLGNHVRRIGLMISMMLVTAGVLWFLTPAAEYLPEGEEAKAFSTMIAPPGYNLLEMDEISRKIQQEMLPALTGDPAAFDRGEIAIPPLSIFSVTAQPESLRVVAETKDPKHIDAFIDIINDRFRAYPG
ncbi:MAG: efflux RND transporter permease subunit, partial [Luteolibacter sp.]